MSLPPIPKAVLKEARVNFRAGAGRRVVRSAWRSYGVPVAGVTLPSLALAVTEVTATARYSIVASNGFGMSTTGICQVRLANGSAAYFGRGIALEPWNALSDLLDLVAIGKHLRGQPSLSGRPSALAYADWNGKFNRAHQTIFQNAMLGRRQPSVFSKLGNEDDDTIGLADCQERFRRVLRKHAGWNRERRVPQCQNT